MSVSSGNLLVNKTKIETSERKYFYFLWWFYGSFLFPARWKNINTVLLELLWADYTSRSVLPLWQSSDNSLILICCFICLDFNYKWLNQTLTEKHVHKCINVWAHLTIFCIKLEIKKLLYYWRIKYSRSIFQNIVVHRKDYRAKSDSRRINAFSRPFFSQKRLTK